MNKKQKQLLDTWVVEPKIRKLVEEYVATLNTDPYNELYDSMELQVLKFMMSRIRQAAGVRSLYQKFGSSLVQMFLSTSGYFSTPNKPQEENKTKMTHEVLGYLSTIGVLLHEPDSEDFYLSPVLVALLQMLKDIDME